jgi:hypothetical protein
VPLANRPIGIKLGRNGTGKGNHPAQPLFDDSWSDEEEVVRAEPASWFVQWRANRD